MRRILLLLMLLPALTYAVDTTGLTKEQRIQLELQIEQMKQNTPTKNVENLKEYAELGESIAKALSTCAKEMGIAINEFSDTKVGAIATLLIIWKVAGEDIFRYILGISFFCVMLPLWIFLFKRKVLIHYINYHENGKVKDIKYREGEGEQTIAWIAMLFALIGIATLIMFAG